MAGYGGYAEVGRAGEGSSSVVCCTALLVVGYFM